MGKNYFTPEQIELFSKNTGSYNSGVVLVKSR